jgi:hypothetical protein
MRQADIPIATAGISAPWWLQPLNEWLALVVAIGSIILIGIRIVTYIRQGK